MNIVAVCACPSGVAHTFMACEGLKNAAKKKGAEIKIETQGAMGIENELTSSEIEKADLVILTNDVKIRNSERFDQKKVFYLSSNDAIRKADKLLEGFIQDLDK